MSVPGRALVTVTVTGLTGSGKSAIYGEIVNTLNAIGVPVVHADEKAWRSECRMTHADWLSALEMYQPTVVMREQNISRKPEIVRSKRTIRDRFKMLLDRLTTPQG